MTGSSTNDEPPAHSSAPVPASSELVLSVRFQATSSPLTTLPVAAMEAESGQSGPLWDLAQAATSHYKRQTELAAREQGTSVPPYSRAELEQQLAHDTQSGFSSLPDAAYIVHKPAHPT